MVGVRVELSTETASQATQFISASLTPLHTTLPRPDYLLKARAAIDLAGFTHILCLQNKHAWG